MAFPRALSSIRSLERGRSRICRQSSPSSRVDPGMALMNSPAGEMQGARRLSRLSDELKNLQALLLAFDQMLAALDERKAVVRGGKNLFADQRDRLGIGIDGLAEALEPLRRVHRVADDRVVDAIRRADIADDHR